MLIFLLILLIIFFLLIVPIPLKLKILYKNKKFGIYLYNINIYNKLFKNRKIKSSSPKRINIKHLSSLLSSLSSFKNSKLKPIIKLNINLTYGLDDAAYTAVLYGMLSSSYPLIKNLLSTIFKIKKVNINITPKMNDCILDFELNSIISINLAKIIYMRFLI
ncbi:DUF2953 domain-containing protein [Clostridium fermenticellae]|nr:DUF2953 domain-containing protein [Clostridium fermenticellae]